MSILDSVLNSVMNRGQPSGESSGFQTVLTNMLSGQSSQQTGGISAIIAQLEQAGLGHAVQSWIGNGPNHAVSPEELHSAFGSDQVHDMANEAGMQPHDFLSQLAQHLPQVMDALSQHGQFNKQE